jgi:hypothetical protein
MVSSREIFVYFLLPVVNFYICFKLGQNSLFNELLATSGGRGGIALRKCKPPSLRVLGSSFAPVSSTNSLKASRSSAAMAPPVDDPPSFKAVDSKMFSAYSEEHLVEMFFPPDSYTLLLNHNPSSACTSYINPMVSVNQECSAVVFADNEASSLTLRFNALSKEGLTVVQGTL